MSYRLTHRDSLLTCLLIQSAEGEKILTCVIVGLKTLLGGIYLNGQAKAVGETALGVAHSFGKFLGGTSGGMFDTSKRVGAALGVLYITGWMIVKWHNMLVGGELFF